MSDDEAEDNETENETESSEDGKSGGKSKLILIIAGVILIIIAGVGGALLMGAFDSLLGLGKPDVAEVVEIPPGPAVYHEFPQLVVDLKKTSARTHYIRIKVVAEIVTRDLPILKEDELKIMDKIQTYLRSQTSKDLSGGKGTEKMRGDIEKIIAKIIAPVKFEGVLFREILLQ